ncbi:M-phase phosphoprotein 8 [Entomophthora muscae]|uniref:M-phase phosphoprotein 8 n=1 Tax=Entomophthora muscae TaxID=34485 RepID=A0ACC2TRV5_9FUNG|nr:M-phase phosphoprotein 8 [Entomophthora muscae]
MSDISEYIVEEIVSHKRINGKFKYQVKWEEYSSSENTWEEEEKSSFRALRNCPDLLAKYWATVKADTENSPLASPQESSEEEYSASSENLPIKRKKIVKRTHQRAKIHDLDSDIDEVVYAINQPSSSKEYPPSKIKSWENLIDSIIAVTKVSIDNQLAAVVKWKNGSQDVISCETLRYKAPNKLFDFYEEHIHIVTPE